MDWTEKESTQQDGGKARDDNVVRLPRDWLGPREELVPFGPPAETESEESEAADSDLPRSAQDFWGCDDSSAVDAGFNEPGPPGRRRWRLAAAASPLRLRPWPSLAGGIADPRRAKQGLIAGAAVVALLVAGLLVSAGTHESPPSGRLTGAGSGASNNPSAAASTTTQTGTPGPAVDALERQARAAQSAPRTRVRRSRSRRRHRPHVRRARHRSQGRHPARKATAGLEPVRYATPRPPAAAGTASETSASSGMTASSASAGADSSPTASAAATASGESASAGGSSGGGSASSSGQPATGANGTLGPGSSPDS